MENLKEQSSRHSVFNKNNLRKWLYPKGYYLHFYKSFDMSFHSHTRLELMYVMTGEMHLLYKDKQSKEHHLLLHPNEYVFIDSGVLHKIYVDDTDTQIYNIEFSSDVCEDSDFTLYNLQRKDEAMKAFLASDPEVCRLRDNGTLLQNLILIQNHLKNNGATGNCLNFMISSLLLLIAKHFSESTKRISGIVYINTAIDFIYDHFNHDCTLKEIAAFCGISQNYLNQLFKTVFSTTAMNFLNKYRIDRAAALLSSSELSINEIRLQTGYKSNINFNQNFKKFMGTTPGKYRITSHMKNHVHAHKTDNRNFYTF